MATVSDRRKPVIENGEVSTFDSRLLSTRQYYPFGMEMPDSSVNSTYRFGFNGQEKVNEWTGIAGTEYDFGARIYDVRIGRWLSCDPLAAKYSNLSPYSYASNSPISFVDPNGDTIKWAAGTEKFQSMTLEIRSSSEIFDELITRLENSTTVYPVKEADEFLQKMVQKQEGEGEVARGASYKGEVLLSAPHINEKTIIEEFFHTFQRGEFYGDSRTTSEVEAEAEVFDRVVEQQIALNTKGITILTVTPEGVKEETIHEGSIENILKVTSQSHFGGGEMEIGILFGQLDMEGTLQIKSSDAQELYRNHLDSFKSAYEGSPAYGGEQRTLDPNAYNELVK